MANKNKAAGTRFESAVVEYLREYFPLVERRALMGVKDKGDLTGIPGWVLELKAYKDIKAGFHVGVEQAKVEKANANAVHAAAIVKRPHGSIGSSYVVMTLEDWAALVGLPTGGF